MSAETTLRYIETLRCLPVGKWRTTGDVYCILQSLGYRVTKRTVERDLHKLAKPFGIELKELGGNLGNEWRRTASLDACHDVPRRKNYSAPEPVFMPPSNTESRGRTLYAARGGRRSTL